MSIKDIGVNGFEILPGSKIRVKNGDELIEATTTEVIHAHATKKITFKLEDFEIFKIPKNQQKETK